MIGLAHYASLGRAARTASEWVDLQWSSVVALLERVAPQARGRLLDVGCGDKPYEHLFLPYVPEYVGIEHETSFQATSAAASKRGPDLVYDGCRLPFEDESFDTVLSVQVLEHTPHPAALSAEMSRVLKADGVLSAPFQFRLHEEPHDYYRYYPHALRALCSAAGLEVTEVHNQGSLWSVLAHKLNSYLAFRVGGLAQAMGKLPHEARVVKKPPVWTLPMVAPLMVGLFGSARLLDRFVPDAEEALGFLIVARRKRETAAAGEAPPVQLFPNASELFSS